VEKRGLERRHLIFYLRVMEQGTPAVLGFLVDLTTEGFMLMSEKPLPVGKKFKLSMRVPRGASPDKVIEFSALSKWCHTSVNPDLFDAGFEMLEITPAAYKQIRTLIKELGFNH
jgi:hypothetical protein